MVIFLDGDNVTWTSYTPIDHVQWQISNQGLHGRMVTMSRDKARHGKS